MAFGKVFLLPVYLWETFFVGAMPVTQDAISAVADVVVFAARLAFIFRGERLEGFHAVGIAAIGTGIVLATSAGRGQGRGRSCGAKA